MKRKISLILVTFLFFPALVSAVETTGLEVVTLQQVLEDVTKTNPAILEALKQYESVLAERSIATSEYYPTVGTEITVGPETTNGVDTNNEDENLVSTTGTLYARQNLFNGGRTTAFVKETDARIRAAAYEVLNVANRVYLESAEAYISVVKANRLLAIAEENALTQERIMRQVREKTEAGFNRVSELYNSESRLALSKGSYISRQQDLNQALVSFHRQFGRLLRPEQFVAPEPDYQVPGSLPENVEIALNNHPALKVAKYNVEKNRFTYDKATAAYLPTLDFELKGQYRRDTGGEEGETTQTGAYLTLNFVFFDGGFRQGQVAMNHQEIRKEYQRSYIERRNVNETVRLAWNILEAEDFKKEYLTEHVALSTKTLEAFKEEYFVGRRTLLDLLNMENEATDAQISMSESVFSRLVALYRIMQATGVLLDEHDTGLRKLVNLDEEPIDLDDDEEIYKDLDLNRDDDVLADTEDQCDNSLPGLQVQGSGCSEENVNTAGYPHIADAQISPYITPQGVFTATPAVSVVVPAAEFDDSMAEGLKSKLVLEAKPNSDFVTAEAMAQLETYTKLLSSHPDARVLIEGYIASDRTSPANTRLSERRANVVKQFMVERGVSDRQLTVIGRGNENPVADNSTSAGRRQNRRIEISLVE